MVRRHLQGEFQFVCLTDDSEGVRAEVRCLPIPNLALRQGIPERGWKKLTTFEADLHGLQGTALFLDVDVVIVDDITPFFEQPGEFLIIHDWKRPWRVTGNSSVYRFEHGRACRRAEPLPRPRRAGARALPQRAGLPVGRDASPGQAGLLAGRLVPQLQVPLHSALAHQPLARAGHPRGRAHPDLPRRGQPARCAGRPAQPQLAFMQPAPWIAEHWVE